MNSFWIPQLGGQIYAMPGMRTHLHLMADGVGEYMGASANFSGAGFSGMKFTARSVSKDDFDQWVRWVQNRPRRLDSTTYAALAKQSFNNPVTHYSSVDTDLYTSIVEKFTMPMKQ